METSAVPLLAEKQRGGYNNCFTLIGKLKMPVYIDEQGNARRLSYNVPNCHKFYHLTYEEAYQQLSEYRKKYPDTSGRVSLWLDNAKYNDLFVFILDFDKIEDENGQKQPVDTEAPFFKGALQLADKVMHSQSGAYHMACGIDKKKAEPLFDSINLLTSSGAKGFVCRAGRDITLDGRNKVDFFCDVPHPIYEWEEWDNTKGLTDKTQELYELIKANFSFSRPQNSVRVSVNNTTRQRRSKVYRPRKKIALGNDAEYQGVVIEGKTENELKSGMTEEQREIFEDLKNIPSDCNDSKWTSVAYDIWHVFQTDDGDELAAQVFLWWSKRGGEKYVPFQCVRKWEFVNEQCSDGQRTLSNNRWRAIMGLDKIVSEEEAQRQAEIQQQLKELGKRIRAERQAKMPADNRTLPLPLEIESVDTNLSAAEPLTFRGLPIQWEHENVSADNALDEEEQSGNVHHRILWGAGKYKRDDFFRAIWGADYKKIREKAIFKGAAADNILRLTTGQRTALEYDALYHRHIDELVLVDEQDEKELVAFFASDDCSTAKETLRRLNYVDGVKKIATFGAGRQQTGAAEFTWCYTKEAVKGGNRYRGVALDWSLWAYGIKTAYNDFLSGKDAKLWDAVRPAMYCQYQNGEVCRMTYAAEDYQ